ncbi:acyltransferase [Pseudomonadota bacterium]|nr:acyltransferase [Pseudomonadota bacterium]
MLNKIWNKTIFGVPMLLVQLCSIILGRLRDYISTLLWRSNISMVGIGGKIQSGVIIRYPNNITLSDYVSVGRGARLESEFSDSKLDIGANSQVNINVRLDFSGDLIIGKNVVISECVSIYTHSHGSNPKSIPRKTPLYIEDNVWIGSNVTILEGVGRIGEGAMVASGSVLFREVHAGKVVGGIPAKVIKEREKY